MSRRINPSVIGAFVLGGIALFVLAVALFGSGVFDSQKTRFICFFDDSVNGLDSGSAVKFKGVTIGKVAGVLLRAESQAAGDNAIPVIVEIDEKLLSAHGIGPHIAVLTEQAAATERGLRARLQQQSLITGMLFIELDFFPGTKPRFHKDPNAGGLREIPTLPSDFGALVKSLTRTLEQVSQINFAGLAQKTDRILAQLETGIAALDLKGINQGALDVAAAATALLADEQTRRLPANANATLDSIRDLSKKLGDTATKLGDTATPLAGEVSQTAAEARRTLAEINRAVENLRILLSPETGIRSTLDDTLQSISAAAAAVRSLADQLSRRPEALLFGKPPQRERD
jgi:paraquat-inducible protein B